MLPQTQWLQSTHKLEFFFKFTFYIMLNAYWTSLWDSVIILQWSQFFSHPSVPCMLNGLAGKNKHCFLPVDTRISGCLPCKYSANQSPRRSVWPHPWKTTIKNLLENTAQSSTFRHSSNWQTQPPSSSPNSFRPYWLRRREIQFFHNGYWRSLWDSLIILGCLSWLGQV